MYRKPHVLMVLAMASAMPALAQQAPDVGQTLRQLETASDPSRTASSGARIQLPVLDSPMVNPGGIVFQVKGFVFEGNTQISSKRIDQELREAFGIAGADTTDWLPVSTDLAGLYEIVSWVSLIYQEAGYPFAQAYVPAQKLENGQVRVVIVEGTYDQATVRSAEADWASQAKGWLKPFQAGNVIRRSDLDRVSLLLGDLPGITAVLSLEPGRTDGTAALEAEFSRTSPYNGEVSLTNYGSRFSGEWQARAKANLNSFLLMGDQVTITALHTDHKMWLGDLKYSLPIGHNGLRGSVNYSDTRYELTKDFEGTSGDAQTTSISVSYPLLRGNLTNLGFSGTLQEKRLFNSVSNGATTESYSTTSVPLTFSFDHQDQLGQGGITYGSVTLTLGDLDKSDQIRRGRYEKLSIDVARVQSISPKLSVFARVSAQGANKNLDSSEGMGLGGSNSVRAYPTGEAFGDEGWLTQLEVRYDMGAVVPYAFYDHGRTKVNARPELVAQPSPDQERAGVGFGVRYKHKGWEADAAVAWRTLGGPPTATQGSDPKPRAWLAVSYKF